MDFGTLRHRVTLDNPTYGPDGDGGTKVVWPPDGGVPSGARLPASIEAMDAQERAVAHTAAGVGLYTVTVRYLRGVTTQTRVTFHDGATDRTLWVTGVTDDQQRHAVLALTCEERLA